MTIDLNRDEACVLVQLIEAAGKSIGSASWEACILFRNKIASAIEAENKPKEELTETES